jgi:hypothetical protein
MVPRHPFNEMEPNSGGAVTDAIKPPKEISVYHLKRANMLFGRTIRADHGLNSITVLPQLRRQ